MIRSHLQSNAVAYVALFFALGGGVAWAVDRNSIKSKHIVNRSVKRVDLKPGSLTGKQVKNNSLTAADIKLSTLGSPGVVTGYIRPDGSALANTPGVTVDHNASGQYTVNIPFSLIPANTPPVPVFDIVAPDDHHIEELAISQGSNRHELFVQFSGGDHWFSFIAAGI